MRAILWLLTSLAAGTLSLLLILDAPTTTTALAGALVALLGSAVALAEGGEQPLGTFKGLTGRTLAIPVLVSFPVWSLIVLMSLDGELVPYTMRLLAWGTTALILLAAVNATKPAQWTVHLGLAFLAVAGLLLSIAELAALALAISTALASWQSRKISA